MGEHYERLFRTNKASLATAISRKLLTLEEFTTVVKEAENIVRPLTYQSEEEVMTGETTPTQRVPRVADGGTPRRVAFLRAAPNIPN